MEKENKYKNLEDVLPLGKHKIKMMRAEVWKDGKPVKGTQRTGVSKNGNKYWQYNTDVKYVGSDGKERHCSYFAFSEEKRDKCEEGDVEINIVEKYVLEDGKLATKMEVEQNQLSVLLRKSESGEIVPATKRIVYVNSLKDDFSKDVEYANPIFEKPVKVEKPKEESHDYGEEEIPYDEIPF